MERGCAGSSVLYIETMNNRSAQPKTVIDVKQICVSIDERTAKRLLAAGEEMQIPLSAAARLAILHGIDYLNNFKTGRDSNE